MSQQKNRVLTGIILAAFIAIGGIYYLKLTRDNNVVSTIDYSQVSPELSLQAINGDQVSLTDYKGKIVLVDFWATWCPPCVAEIPHFITLQEKYAGKVQVLGVSIDKSDAPVISFYSEKGINYPVMMYSDDHLKGFGKITSIPTTFIIDQTGKIKTVVTGYRDLQFFEDHINGLL